MTSQGRARAWPRADSVTPTAIPSSSHRQVTCLNFCSLLVLLVYQVCLNPGIILRQLVCGFNLAYLLKNFATFNKESRATMTDKDYEIDIEGTGHDEEMDVDNETSTVTRRGRGFRGRNDDAHFTARNSKTDRLAGTPGPATAVRCRPPPQPKLPLHARIEINDCVAVEGWI